MEILLKVLSHFAPAVEGGLRDLMKVASRAVFLDLGPVTNKDNTARIESRIQRRLLQLRKEYLISKQVYEAIRRTGSQRPRMYGLPKIHKKDVPLRPILSMTGSAQHQLAKWLTSLLQPVLQNLFSNCVSDSFTFVKEVRKFTFSSSVFLCSFDISSLFTNVPLAETIEICADALYNDDSMAPSFPRNIFVELMQLATSSVEFSFNNNMHRQIDGVAMGSPLGPALANIFVGYKKQNFSTSPKDRWCTSGTLMILSPYSTMKKTATLFSSSSTPFIPHFASPMKRNLITLSLSLTCW